MADFTAIAAVSRTVRALLLDRMVTPGTVVTLAPPDILIAGINGPRVNLYLYEVLEQPQLKNQNIPGREHPAAFGHPPLSLTMRYLMTSHARSEDQQDSDVIAQAVLGDAMLVLHDFGGRMDNLTLLTNRAGAIGDPLLDAVLRDEFERVKFVLHSVALEEISRLWSAIPKANLRRSVVYEASLVQIEGRRPQRQAPPVERRRVFVRVTRAPALTAAYRTPPTPPNDTIRDLRVAIGEEVTIEHPPTLAERLYVRFGSLEPIRVPTPSPGIIALNVPDDQYPIDLDNPVPRSIPARNQVQPGPLEIILIGVVNVEGVDGGLNRGIPTSAERQLRSNSLVLQLVPSVTGMLPPNGDVTAILRLTGTRLWSPTLPSQVIIGDVAVPIRPPGPGDPWAEPTPTQVEVPVSAVAGILPPTGVGDPPYRVSAQVNGARSRESGFTFRLDP